MKNIIVGVFALLALNANAALIEIYETNSGLGNIAQAQAVIDGAAGPDTSVDSNNIFFSDVGHFGAGAFPGGHTTTFVLTATGFVDTSVYSALFIRHDDGIDVDLGGNDLYTFNGNTGLRDSGWLNFADTGLEALDLLFWENGGAASVLVWGQLRGTGGHSEIANISSVSEPGSIALLALGLVGLGAARRKA